MFQTLIDMPPPNGKKEMQSFLGIINYLGKFSLSTAEVCKPLRKLSSARNDWTWNSTCQILYGGLKSIIKKDASMKFYNEKETTVS